MIPPRAIWRLLVLPAYMLLAAALLALVTIFGGVLRWRRRLAAIRRGRAAHSQRADWSPDAAQGVAPGSRG